MDGLPLVLCRTSCPDSPCGSRFSAVYHPVRMPDQTRSTRLELSLHQFATNSLVLC